MPRTAPSTFPPVSMARSTITEPGFIASIISFVIIIGALRPKICAVVITISAWAQYCIIVSRCLFNCCSVNAFAYPCAVCPVSPRSTSTNFAPSERTSFFAIGRVSNASTFAPSRRAVAIACNPATPVPMINTFDGCNVPAGVIIIGKILLMLSAARITAAYPARLACELNASIFCARVDRGIISIDSADIF